VVTITVTCYLWAPSISDHFFAWGAISKQCCQSFMKKNPRIYLEKKNNIKKTQTYKMLKKFKNKLETYASGTCTLKLR